MKALIVLLAVAGAMLAGCASTSSPSYGDRGSRYDTKIVKDADYIRAVERKAKRQRVEIHWVNPPTRRVANRPD